MDTEDARNGHVGSQASDSSSRASLQLELRVPDKQMLTIFRDAFLRWLTHRTGPFGRAIGFGSGRRCGPLPASTAEDVRKS